LDVIRWGKQNSKQRFKCKNCGILFTRNDSVQKLENRFIWFKKWIIERQIFSTLSRDIKLSIRTLQTTFSYFLDKEPQLKVRANSKVNLRLDATYFNKFCLVCYQDNSDGYIQLIRFTDYENTEEILEDINNLIRLGVSLESITSDGHKSILKAIKEANIEDLKAQRCLVHIQRMCLIWLTQYPQHESGRELRTLVLMLLKIKTRNDELYWKREFIAWYQRHKLYINQKTYNPQTAKFWYTHKMLRRSYTTIKQALPNMFHYIQNPNIPHTTNGIEGYFGHLKNHLDLHRGLTIKNRINFIKWYIYFSNEK
jgi:hypothetical protein